jgi:hypothetical protein
MSSSSTSWITWPSGQKTLRFFITWGTTSPTTQHHIQMIVSSYGKHVVSLGYCSVCRHRIENYHTEVPCNLYLKSIWLGRPNKEDSVHGRWEMYAEIWLDNLRRRGQLGGT